jgi:pSer/pThr/pTyr-binding forkhead associated (FHA) protein
MNTPPFRSDFEDDNQDSTHPAAPPVPGSRPAGRTPTVLETGFDKAGPFAPTLLGSAAEALAFHPTQRPAMALLYILDDGRDDGEIVRLRADRYVVGRGECDVVIPHDTLISSHHAQLSRRRDHKGQTCWYLRDLGSTNGTYVRIGKAGLDANQQLLLGSRHYRFEDPLQAAAAPADPYGDVPETRRALGGGAGSCLPALVEMTEKGDGQRHEIQGADVWVGRDRAQCSLVLDDPMVSPRHVRLFRDPGGRWRVEDGRSRNGTWFRIRKVRFKRTSQFQLGEQRFEIRLLA